jgi:hypothetical protein
MLDFLNWMLNPLAANAFGCLILLAFSAAIGAPAYSHLWRGGMWTDRVFTGIVRGGVDVYWHVWFLVPLSLAFTVGALVFLYFFDDGPSHWRRWLIGLSRRRGKL